MGGAIAIRYMARHQGHQVGRLALMAAAAPSFTARPGLTREQVDGFIRGLYKDRPQVLVSFGMMFFGRPVTPAFMGWFQDGGLKAAGYATIKTLESLRDEDLTADLTSIRVPTGIFAGVLDQVCPFPFAQELNRGIAGSVLYRFDYSGHAVYYDELQRFNQTFLQFLGSE
jgi:non-heme chloroperoxidase